MLIKDLTYIGQISGDPVNMDNVYLAVEFFKRIVEEDDLEARYESVQERWKELTNDERIEISLLMKDKAPGTRRMYNSILMAYVNYIPE